jgi:formyl-CoA transferase
MMEAAISFIPDPFAFRCGDGKLLAIHLSSQTKFWDGLLAVTERRDLGEDARFATREARIAHFTALTGLLAGVFVTRDRGAWMALLEAQDVPFAPIHTIPEVIEDPQVQHIECFRTLHHPTMGDLLTVRRPVRIDGGRHGTDLAAPVLGEHTDAVLAELGYSDSDIAAKRAARLI